MGKSGWWRTLERTDKSEVEQANYRDKVARIAEAQRAGRLDAKLPAAHVFAFLLGVVQSWAIASEALRDAAGEDAARERRRESVREAVARRRPRRQAESSSRIPPDAPITRPEAGACSAVAY